MSATERRWSASEETGESLRCSARSIRPSSPSRESSSPVRKWRVKRGRVGGMRVVTWNLFHGRAVPGAGRSGQHEFAGALASWAWDVALLQEVPPWYPGPLAEAAGAVQRRALTSRNAVLPLRRWAAERWPDVVKSQGGGANAILVRSEEIVEDRAVALRRWPERRVAHGVRLASGGGGGKPTWTARSTRGAARTRSSSGGTSTWGTRAASSAWPAATSTMSSSGAL